MREGRLPNVLIIGAMKSGTTSLHGYLHEHPEIFMAEKKELFYWHRDDYLERLDDYKRHFPVSAVRRGESSVSYTIYPLYPHVPERIGSLLPEIRLIYVVRDPIARIISQYVHEWSDHREYRPLDEALRAPDDPRHPYVAPSRYATQLGRYLAHFDRSQMLIVDQSDLLHNRRATLSSVFDFLGVDSSFDTPRFDAVSNTRGDQRRPPKLLADIRHSRLVSGSLNRLPPSVSDAFVSTAERLVARKHASPRLTNQTRGRLIEALRDEIRDFRDMTGRPFADWSV